MEEKLHSLVIRSGLSNDLVILVEEAENQLPVEDLCMGEDLWSGDVSCRLVFLHIVVREYLGEDDDIGCYAYRGGVSRCDDWRRVEPWCDVGLRREYLWPNVGQPGQETRFVDTYDTWVHRRTHVNCGTMLWLEPGGSYKGSADSLQFKPQESNFDSAPVQLKHEDSHKGTISSYLEESGDVGYRNSWHGGPTESLDSDSSAPKTHDCIRSPKPPSDGRQLNSTSASRENNGMENPKSIKLSSMDKPESSAENDVHISKAGEDGHAFAEVGIYGIASLPEEEGENILEKNLERPSLPTDVCPIESIPCGSGAPSTRQKGKEKILPGMDVDQNVSKEEDGSHESVESSNSGRKFSSGKRAWCFEQNLFITSKKMKKQCQETPCSTSLFGHDSSFMNYISNMMKGSSKFNQDETSPEISGRLAHHSRSHDSLVLLHDKTQDPSCRPTGFQSIFKSLYFPSLKVQEKETCSLNNQVHAESPKEPEVAKKTLCDGGSTHVSSNSEDDVKLLQLVHVSNLEVCQAGKSLSGQQDIPSANAIGVDGKLKRESKNDHTACNVMPGIELDARTSGSSFQNKSISPVEYKGFSKHDSPDQIKSSNSTTKRSNLLESLWITRFSPKFSQPLLNSHQCNLDTATAIEVSTDCNWFLPHSQNAVSTSNDPNHIENGHGSSAKDETNPASKNIQTFSMGHNASCGLKRNRAPGDLKFNSILSPILSSERFKKLEAMVSIFARRLEALKHINIVHAKTTESETHLSTICFFCGSRGHLLRDCSEIVESDLDDLLRNTNLYNGAEELPCLCIRCLQFNHWAIACPYAPSREQITATGSASLNSKCQVVGENAVSHWESSRATNELPVRTNVCGDASETIVLNGSSSAGKKDITGKTIVLNGSSSADKKDITGKTIILNGSSSAGKKDITGNDCICLLVEKNAFREFIINGKHASSEEKGLKGNEIVPISNVQRQMTNVPRGLFQAIRRLRLSRSDILK
ncbi:hypothetical protein ACLOJK_004377 [Asimina triloba]